MAFWDGDKWIPEVSPDARASGRRVSGSPISLALIGLVAAVVLAAQAGPPAPTAGNALATSPDEGHAAADQADSRLALGGPVSGSPLISASVPGRSAKTPASSTPPVQGAATGSTSSNRQIAVAPATAILPAGGSPIYIHYYLWWTQRHWQDKLGTAYPYSANPLPLPGQTDAAGCSPTVSYPGATIVDIPSQGLYNQAQAATFDSHIRTATAYGVTGFVADWAGTGAAEQTPSSSGYNARLDLLVQRVDAWNATHVQKFRLALDFAAFGNYSRPASAIINDLRYFAGRYDGDPAFASAFSTHPMVMLIGSRKYSLATIQAVSTAARPSVFLLGDETYASLPRDAAYLDGSSYYWSSESPTNSGAKAQIGSLGSQLHGAGKPWFAPFTAGYDSVLKGGHCVPRNGLSTLDTIWSWNSASDPDAWFGISWNEYVENTYLEPSLKYGSKYLAEVVRLAGL